VKLCAAITFADGRAVLDITGSSPQVAGPMNATRTMAQVTIMHLIRCLGDPRIPNNSGFLARTSVIGPAGTVVTAQSPAAVVGAFETTFQLYSTLLKAMHPALPDRIPACSKSLVMCLGFAGTDPRSSEYYCYMETVAGGDGARPIRDGWDAVQSELQDTENAPIEEVELGYPVLIRRYELIRDSGGRGRYRGGLGIRRDFEFPYADTSFSLLADGRKFGPWGLMGGEAGRTARFQFIQSEVVRELPSKITFRVPKGGIVRVETPGGGGFGDPALRDPQAIADDILDGKVAPDDGAAGA
jgi:N-methylhydantoinase B